MYVHSMYIHVYLLRHYKITEGMGIEQDIRQSKFKSEYHKLVINILYSQSWLSYQQQKLFKQYGLTPPQFNILRILRGQHPNPATVNLLIERMIDKTSNASRIIDKLEAKGMVKRSSCPHDRRAVDVLITDEGLAVLAKLDAKEDALERKMVNLTEAEAKQLNHLLDKMRQTKED